MQDLEAFESILIIKMEWEEKWAAWKSGRFADLETKDMEEFSNTSYKKLYKMSRDYKVIIIALIFYNSYRYNNLVYELLIMYPIYLFSVDNEVLIK